MKLIVGLGNPGLFYQATRHNAGSYFLKVLAEKYKASLKLDRSFKSRIAKIKIGNQEYVLALPATYMNLSGEAVKSLVDFYKLGMADLLVIHDELDLDLGVIRFKNGGGSGGHRGIESIKKTLASQDFCRLRIGIGRDIGSDKNKEVVSNYVLSEFSRLESVMMKDLRPFVIQACGVWGEFGMEKAMNEFNKKKEN